MIWPKQNSKNFGMSTGKKFPPNLQKRWLKSTKTTKEKGLFPVQSALPRVKRRVGAGNRKNDLRKKQIKINSGWKKMGIVTQLPVVSRPAA